MTDNLYEIDHTQVSYSDAMRRMIDKEPGFALVCDRCKDALEKRYARSHKSFDWYKKEIKKIAQYGVIYTGVYGKLCASCFTDGKAHNERFWEEIP